MKKIIIILSTLLFIIAAFTRTTQKSRNNFHSRENTKINIRIHPSIIHLYDYNSLSEWNQLRYNLAKSIKNAHGSTKLYDNYAKVLHCESSGWKNSRNPKSSASGLFQCMKSTFSEMKRKNPNHYLFKKTTFNDFRNKPLKIQALYFELYLKLYDNKLKLIKDNQDQATRQIYTYLMVLKPSAVGKKWNDPVFIKGDSDYKPNKGIPHSGNTIKLVDVYKFCINRFNQ